MTDPWDAPDSAAARSEKTAGTSTVMAAAYRSVTAETRLKSCRSVLGVCAVSRPSGLTFLQPAPKITVCRSANEAEGDRPPAGRAGWAETRLKTPNEYKAQDGDEDARRQAERPAVAH